MSTGLILGIESSCDETAASVVRDGREVLASVVSSQIDLHAKYGGVVPELAGRAHLDRIIPVVNEALDQAGCRDEGGTPRIDAVAATCGPGLVGSLLVGVSAAKALAMAWGLPFVGVNHLEGHLHATFLDEGELELPVVVLLASGGHTLLVGMERPGRYEILGETADDAAGEAFDKVSRFLDLGYPGGPAIQRAAESGDPKAVRFPRPLAGVGCEMSFSGLKTAVINYVREHPEIATNDVAASFQQAVVDILVEKTTFAARSIGAKGICLAGGVAANTPLRDAMSVAGEKEGRTVHLPSRSMCTDNAAMIAAAGWFRLHETGPSPLSTGATPNYRLGTELSDHAPRRASLLAPA